MRYAAERAAKLQETLTQAAQNNPNMDSPTVTVNKVKDLGENFQRESKLMSSPIIPNKAGPSPA